MALTLLTDLMQYLLNCGVPAVDIVREVSSFDTIGNGYFTMAIHAIPRKWSRLAVVTSEFHMPRSRAIFTKLCALAERAGHGPFALSFVEVSDEGVFPDEASPCWTLSP